MSDRMALAIHVIVPAIATTLVMQISRDLFGRLGMWIIGLSIFVAAVIALYRLRRT